MSFLLFPGERWPSARPIVKWTGGKSGELDVIADAMPPRPCRILEPFAGGAAVAFATPPSIPVVINDRSDDLVSLYRAVARQDAGLTAAMAAIDQAWLSLDKASVEWPDDHLSTLASMAAETAVPSAYSVSAAACAGYATSRLLARRRKLLARTDIAIRKPDAAIVSAVKGGLYTALRATFNARPEPTLRAALFWFLRDFAFGGMFRTSASGDFNVPYGGASYNRRSVSTRLKQVASVAVRARMNASSFSNADFEDFLDIASPGREDLVFLDPPYDSRFSTYDGQSFARADHLRLAAWMRRTGARWMMVIAATDFVRDTYCSIQGAVVTEDDKTYMSSIKGRYDQRAVHLVISNYARGTACVRTPIPADTERSMAA